MKENFEIFALIISVGAYIPYIIDTVKGKVRPERISWLLWSMLGLTYYLSALLSDGADLFTLGELCGQGLIFLFSLKYGVGGKSRFDVLSLIVALAAFSLLFILDGVIVGLLLALAVDAIGAVLTLRKLSIDPTSESKLFWACSATASLLALVSLKELSTENIVFPAYLLILSLLILFKATSTRTTTKKDLKQL